VKPATSATASLEQHRNRRKPQTFLARVFQHTQTGASEPPLPDILRRDDASRTPLLIKSSLALPSETHLDITQRAHMIRSSLPCVAASPPGPDETGVAPSSIICTSASRVAVPCSGSALSHTDVASGLHTRGLVGIGGSFMTSTVACSYMLKACCLLTKAPVLKSDFTKATMALPNGRNLIEAKSTSNSSACHTVSRENKRKGVIGTHICYCLEYPPE
jgi:hypothetical protein